MRRVLLLVAGLSCGCGERADSGLDALLRVQGAQFFPGAMPKGRSGPPVTSVELSTNFIAPGQRNKPLEGTVDPRATAAAIGLRGDKGYWVVPTGLPDVQAPDFPTYNVKLDVSRDLKSGKYELVVRAADAEGHMGPESTQPLSTKDPAATDAPLEVSLTWDTEADLDLHVVDPNGIEIWKRDINSYEAPPPGQTGDPADVDKGGILDFDSNAECVIDGRRNENVIWKVERPAGHYLVRVDTFSLCDAAAAHWDVEVFAAGRSIAHAKGTSGEVDTEMPHDRGAGVLAVEFDLP